MCKIMGLTNCQKVDIIRATNVVGDLIKSQSDGFGLMALNVDGSQYVQRQTKLPYRFIKPTALDKYIKSDNYEIVGELNQPQSIFWHGRVSTNQLGLNNTHPITKHGWSLIHNGVVNNRGDHYNRQCQTDTEHLVHYMAHGGINEIEKHITGYYAFIAIDPNGQTHIVKDSIAPLSVAWSDDIDSYIFASTGDLIDLFCFEIGITCTKINSLIDNTYLVMRGNELISAQTIAPRGYDYAESKWSHKSLGFGVDDWSSWDPYDDYRGDITEKTKNTDNQLWYDVSEDYLTMLSQLDGSYEIYSSKGKKIKIERFKRMQLKHKILCTVVRYDGLVIDPFKRGAA